jgi:hypothetical protein
MFSPSITVLRSSKHNVRDARDPSCHNHPARSRKTPLVAVCFADEAINHVFAALLEARGVPTLVTHDLKSLAGAVKVITEPQFFPALPNRFHAQTLVVGNPGTLAAEPVQTLSRPLTEIKIERALARFLS